jgi:hypothetical protein
LPRFGRHPASRTTGGCRRRTDRCRSFAQVQVDADTPEQRIDGALQLTDHRPDPFDRLPERFQTEVQLSLSGRFGWRADLRKAPVRHWFTKVHSNLYTLADYASNSISNVLASCRSGMLKPSVKAAQIGASRSRAPLAFTRP